MHQGVDMHAATKRKLHLSEKVYTAIIKQMCILVCYMCGRLQFDFEKIIYLKIAASKVPENTDTGFRLKIYLLRFFPGMLTFGRKLGGILNSLLFRLKYKLKAFYILDNWPQGLDMDCSNSVGIPNIPVTN